MPFTEILLIRIIWSLFHIVLVNWTSFLFSLFSSFFVILRAFNIKAFYTNWDMKRKWVLLVIKKKKKKKYYRLYILTSLCSIITTAIRREKVALAAIDRHLRLFLLINTDIKRRSNSLLIPHRTVNGVHDRYSCSWAMKITLSIFFFLIKQLSSFYLFSWKKRNGVYSTQHCKTIVKLICT